MEEIRKRIFELAEPKYKEFHSKLCPGTNNIIGVTVPNLRKLAKELSKEYKTNLEKIGNDYYEEIMLQGMIIGLAKMEYEERLEYLTNFIPKINNWAVCDVTCSGLKFIKNNKKNFLEFLKKYLKSEKEFELRFAIVILLDYYIEDDYIDEVLNIIDNISHEGYYVKMAQAWAISICYIKQSKKTMQYLKQSKLDDFTYNKAIQKIRESYRVTDKEKEMLKKMKK